MNADNVWRELVMDVAKAPLVTGKRPKRMIPGWLLSFTSVPLIACRATAWENALRELEWLCYGNGHVPLLHQKTRHWWERWGETLPGVGFTGVNAFVDGVRHNPYSRRNVFTTYTQTKPACPRNDFVLQTTVTGNVMDVLVFQRTCDMMRGANHNWLQYWAFSLWVAHRAGLRMGTLRWIAGDVHLYEAHTEVAMKAANAVVWKQTPDMRYTTTGPDFRAMDFQLTDGYCPVVCDPVEYI